MASSIQVTEESGVKYLCFSDQYIQGAMRINNPNALELAYTQEMMAGILMRDLPWPRSVLLVGLGAGSLTKFIYHHFPNTRITVVEIDPDVIQIAQEEFHLPEPSPRLHFITDDGANYMRSQGPVFDYILIDGFDKNGRAGILDTPPFYQACRARLSQTGLLSINLLGKQRGFHASQERISNAFDGRSIVFPSCDSGNAIAFAAVGDDIKVPYPELVKRSQNLAKEVGLNFSATLPRLQQSGKLTNNILTL